MVHRQYEKINAYEKEWRKKHKIPENHPSTLFNLEEKKIQKTKKLKLN